MKVFFKARYLMLIFLLARMACLGCPPYDVYGCFSWLPANPGTTYSLGWYEIHDQLGADGQTIISGGDSSTVYSSGYWLGLHNPDCGPSDWELRGYNCLNGQLSDTFRYLFFAVGNNCTNFYILDGSNLSLANVQGNYQAVVPNDPLDGAASANSPFNNPFGIPLSLLLRLETLPRIDTPINVPTANSDNNNCNGHGMPVWSVSEPYISLWLHDEPLGYQPAIGSRISFELAFKQRENAVGLNPYIFGVGKRWNCSWISYVSERISVQIGSSGNPYLVTNMVVNLPNGGQVAFSPTNNYDYLTGTTLTGDTTNGFTLTYPDGSKDIYGFIPTNSVYADAFLTQHWNPQSQETRLIYSAYNTSSPVIRLQYVIDGDGRTNFIYYNPTNAYSTNLISQVVDPFNRSVSLTYDSNGNLTNITDVAGNSSSMAYDLNSWVTNLITPYGTNSFAITDTPLNIAPPNGRSVLVTQPDGGHQLYLYEDNAPGMPTAYPSSAVPVTPFANTLDTNLVNYRNSFHWGPRQYANLSNNIISSFTATDFRLARMKHWLQSSFYSLGQTLSFERDPSPDNGGTIEGQKTWYDYPGKPNSAYEGTQVEPSLIAQVLPDGNTQFTQLLRNNLGGTTNLTTTYSAGGSVAYRTSTCVYAPNQIDLLVATNALGVQVSENIYNAYHEVTTNYDATNEVTVYTYNTNQQLTSVTLPNLLVTTNIYETNNFVAQRIDLGLDTNSYTYSNDLVLTHTDPRGLTTTTIWDALQRPQRVSFPDGTFITNTYNALDLVQTVDRMKFTNSFGYDSMRRMIAETNALGTITAYGYCECGALNSVTNALGTSAQMVTSFSYDNQGNVINTLYADGYSVTKTYNLLGQVVSTIDSGGNGITNTYNNQGLLTSVTNTFGQVQSTAYDILDRVSTNVDANGISVAATYDNLNRPLNRSYPDGGVEHWGYTPNVSGATSYTNQIGDVVTYTYDELGRQTTNTVLGVTTTTFTYDGAGDRLTLTDGKNQTTTWTYDIYGNVSNKVDAAGNLVFNFQYDADNRLTNRLSIAKGNTAYVYDSVNNLLTINYQHSPGINLAYDVLNRLTTMADAVGTTTYGYDSVGELLSEAGPWANDTVSYSYTNRLRTGLSLNSQPSAFNLSYGYDISRRMTNVTSPAGSFSYLYGAPSTASALVDAILLPNGARITNSYDNVARLLSTRLLKSDLSVLDSESYCYNQASQRIAETNTAGDFRNYTYDNASELKTAIGKEAGGTPRWHEQLGYAYDAAGNLNYKTNSALVETFNVNNLNELTTVSRNGTLTVAGTTTTTAANVTVNGSNAVLYADATFAATNMPISGAGYFPFTAIAQDSYGRVSSSTVTVGFGVHPAYSYDLNGNLLGESSAVTNNRAFAYDDENQLTSVWVTNVWRDDFVYDGKFRRRIERDYVWSSAIGNWQLTNEVRYVYDGNVVIQERNAANVPLVTYTRSGSTLLARTDYGQEIPGAPATAYYHLDCNANVTMLIFANQIPAAKYQYGPFGEILSMSGPLASLNVYRFASKEWNNSAGIYYFVRRYYDPILQRFINRDPIAEQGGINLYAYVANNPVNLIDLLGLCPNLADLIRQLQGQLDQLDMTEAGLGLPPNLQLIWQLNQINQLDPNLLNNGPFGNNPVPQSVSVPMFNPAVDFTPGVYQPSEPSPLAIFGLGASFEIGPIIAAIMKSFNVAPLIPGLDFANGAVQAGQRVKFVYNADTGELAFGETHEAARALIGTPPFPGNLVYGEYEAGTIDTFIGSQSATDAATRAVITALEPH